VNQGLPPVEQAPCLHLDSCTSSSFDYPEKARKSDVIPCAQLTLRTRLVQNALMS